MFTGVCVIYQLSSHFTIELELEPRIPDSLYCFSWPYLSSFSFLGSTYIANWVLFPRSMMLKVQFPDKQHERHLGTGRHARSWAPSYTYRIIKSGFRATCMLTFRSHCGGWWPQGHPQHHGMLSWSSAFIHSLCLLLDLVLGVGWGRFMTCEMCSLSLESSQSGSHGGVSFWLW